MSFNRIQKNKWYSAVLKYLAGVLGSLLYLGVLILIGSFISVNDNDGTYLILFLPSFALGPLIIYGLFSIWKNRKSFTKENFSKFLQRLKSSGGTWLKLSGYLILIFISIILIFVIGGWILSLSATTIIIVLLILILLK